MSYSITDLLIESKTATVDIPAYRLLKYDVSGDHTVTLATDGSQYILGVSMCSVSQGMCLDVMTMGVHGIKIASSIIAGQPITADADGCGVLAGDGDYIVGFAIKTGVGNEIIPVRIIGQRI